MNRLSPEEKMMKKALRLARKAETENEVPVGAIVVDENGTIIGRGYNRREKRQSVTEHAELMAIASACRKLHSWRLENCSMYVTLEPCVMCSGAIIQSRIAHVYYGAKDPKAGAVDSVVSLFEVPQWNHHPEWTGGILEEECSTILKNFFRRRREEKKKLKALARQNALPSEPDVRRDESRSENVLDGDSSIFVYLPVLNSAEDRNRIDPILKSDPDLKAEMDMHTKSENPKSQSDQWPMADRQGKE